MSIARHHNEWLQLVPSSGPFLSLMVLKDVFPQGLDAHNSEHAARLRQAFEEWEDNHHSKRPDPSIHRAWIKFVLDETLGFEELLAEGQAIPQTLKTDINEYGVTLRPDWVVNDPQTKTARLLIQAYPQSQSLTKPVADSRWKTSPDTRMAQLLHDTGIRLGLVTNGEHWMLVNAPKGETTGYASWYSNLLLEEPLTLRAFRTLLGADRFFSVPEDQTLETLLTKSAENQQEVTDQLGYQVRKAVEVLIQSLDKADQDHGRTLLADVPEKVLYEAALTVMMRLVFLFCAEERGLLLLGDELYDKNYAVSTLREQLRSKADQFGEEILDVSGHIDAWMRLLTTFRVVFAGVRHDRFKLPAYGGSLFDPDRFPFLEGRPFGTTWKDTEATPLPVNNRTVLHLLDALQMLKPKRNSGLSEARKLSFRWLDIEQIGHVYEGLLDHTAKRATEPLLGLEGSKDKEPEIPLSALEAAAAKGEDALLSYLHDVTGRTEKALQKALKTPITEPLENRFRTACQDGVLWKRVEPFAGLVRFDTTDYPVVITVGSVFVTSGTDRRSSGTHYTPKSLTEPIVQYTLEPLVFDGPAEGKPKSDWKLHPAAKLLDLKVCDMACGSGAFLVQACRYLSERVLEAWDEAERSHPETPGITPAGEAASGAPHEQLIPTDPDERQAYALRLVAQRCLYGVDKNPLAVEMAKLSLWLLTLAKDKPFEFLDHALRSGDSLVGIHNLDQLKKFSLDGKGEDNRLLLHFLDDKIQEAITLRRQLTEMQANTVEDVEAQDRMLREANEKIDRLKCAADMLISAEFVPGSAADKRAARDDAAIKVAVHFNDSDLPTFRREAQKALGSQATFHWPVEFPEVMVERGGFDAFIGNPPFLGGMRIGQVLGDGYAAFFKGRWSHRKGHADLVVYFMLRSWELTRFGLGLITTNSLSEGDTREIGLSHIIDLGGAIYRATRTMTWPGIAGVFVSQVFISKPSWKGSCVLNGVLCKGINSRFEDESDEGDSFRLSSNANWLSKGTGLVGIGFVVEPELAKEWIDRDSRYRDILFRYLNAEDFNSSPDQSPKRMVINFRDFDFERASEFHFAMNRLTEMVKPIRDGITTQIHEKCYWKYWDKRAALYEAVEKCKNVLVCPVVTTYINWAFVPKNWIYSNEVYVLPTDEWGPFATLQSSLHISWVTRNTSTLKSHLRYTTTDSFQTFPFPHKIEHGTLPRVAISYHEHRKAIMIDRNIGLTKLYHLFHDSDALESKTEHLRSLQAEMDYAVAAAYGWTDLDLGHGFHETKQGVRYTISEPARREVLARLLKLNHERYAEEVAQGLHDKKKPAKRAAKKKAPSPSLFDDDDA